MSDPDEHLAPLPRATRTADRPPSTPDVQPASHLSSEKCGFASEASSVSIPLRPAVRTAPPKPGLARPPAAFTTSRPVVLFGFARNSDSVFSDKPDESRVHREQHPGQDAATSRTIGPATKLEIARYVLYFLTIVLGLATWASIASVWGGSSGLGFGPVLPKCFLYNARQGACGALFIFALAFNVTSFILCSLHSLMYVGRDVLAYRAEFIANAVLAVNWLLVAILIAATRSSGPFTLWTNARNTIVIPWFLAVLTTGLAIIAFLQNRYFYFQGVQGAVVPSLFSRPSMPSVPSTSSIN